MNKLCKTPPMEIVTRVLLIETLKDLGAETVRIYNPNLVTEFIEEDEEGKEVTNYELDYAYMLFDAPLFQLETVFRKLEEEEKAKKPKIIIP